MSYAPVRSTSKLLEPNSQAQSSHGNGTDTSSQIVSLLTTLVNQTQAASTMASPQGRVQIFDFTKKDQCLAPGTTHALALPQPGHPPSKLLSKQKLHAQCPSQVNNLHCQPHPFQLSKKQDKNRKQILNQLLRVWRTMKQKPWQLCRQRKIQATPRAEASKDLRLQSPNKRQSQPRWSQRLGVLPKAASARGHKQNQPGQVQIKAGDLAKYGCKTCRGNPKACEQCWKDSYQGGSTGMPTVTVTWERQKDHFVRDFLHFSYFGGKDCVAVRMHRPTAAN